VGTTGSGYELALVNGGSDTLHVSSLAISGTNAVDFTVGATDCVGAAVAPGSSCWIPLTFTPTASGPRAATLSVVDDALNGPSQFSLNATGTAAQTTFTPSSLAFPDTQVGQSVTQWVNLSSDGTASLDVSAVSVSGAGSAAYQLTNDGCSGKELPASIGCTIAVSFAPPAFGSFSAALLVADNAAGSPQAVTLNGNGLRRGEAGGDGDSADGHAHE
jgi:hypothetical protein